MKRLTQKNADGRYFSEETDLQVIIDRLAAYENAFEDLSRSMTEIPQKLDKMKAEGREKTVRYREMFGQKLINNSIMIFFEKHGISDK